MHEHWRQCQPLLMLLLFPPVCCCQHKAASDSLQDPSALMCVH